MGEQAPQIVGGSKPEPSDTDDGELTHERIQEIIRAELADAIDYRDSVVAPERAEASSYYEGHPGIVPSEEGRSSAVSMDERDTILAILPSLVRIFLGSTRAVELVPERATDVDVARQRTDYLNYVIREVPGAFKSIYFALKDALLRRPGGVLKWWWDTADTVQYETYTGMLEPDVLALLEDPAIEDGSFEESGREAAPEGMLLTPGPDGKVPTYTVRLKYRRQGSGLRFQYIPGEELLYNRDVTDFREARILTHRREISFSDLVAMGYDPEELEEYATEGGFTFRYDEEFLRRRAANEDGGPSDRVGLNPALRTALYCEHLIPLDRDGDGIAELTKVCTLGDDYYVVRVEDAPELNFALFEMDPEPGQLGGMTVHTLLHDIQRIKTAVMRAVLDSLRASTDPRIAAMEDMVDFNDLLNGELGGVIRTQGDPNAVLRVLDVPFLGAPALGVLEYLDKTEERRVGQTQGSQGLNAEHLQSTTAMAIGAQLSAAQQRIELIARVLAETGFKPFFAGVQRTLMRHQQVGRMVRLRDRWIEGDPRTWAAALDVQINVGLGAGTPSDQIEFLQGVLNKQEAVMKELGPSPIVDYERYSNTLIKAAEVGGFTDGERFFGRVPAGWAPPPPPEKPDPAILLAQIEREKIQQQVEIERLKLEQQRLKLQADTETARMKIEADMQVTILELETKFNVQIEEGRVTAAMERMRAETEARTRVREAEIEQATRVQEAAMAPAPTGAAPA